MLVTEESTFNAQTALEEVAVSERRGEDLSALSKNDEAMAAFARWLTEDPVGFQTALAKLTQTKPKLPSRVAEAFARAVEAMAATGSNRRTGAQPTRLASTLPHPSGEDLLVPAGYLLDTTGTYKVDRRRGRELVAHYPLILEGNVRDAESDLAMVVVGWRANGEWRRMAISREAMGVSSDLARISGQFGAPIHSSNAALVVNYFSAFEALNQPKFEEVRGISRMGWTHDMQAFLIGTNLLTENTEEEIQTPQTLKGGWGSSERIFLPSAPEVGRILAGYHRKGDLEGWMEALRIAADYPTVLAGVYLSLLPPLMRVLGADNLVFEWSGRSSTGKTSALTLAASVWGQPKINLEPSIVSSWRVTDVYIERLLSTIGDLPFFLDDTRTATPGRKNGADPVQVVYDVVAGVSKGRGQVIGTEARKSWRTVPLSTGEDPITAGATKQGVFARTWAVNAWPWGETSPKTAALVLRMESVLADHYGHLGPLWVQRLMRSKPHWGKWRAVYQQTRDKYGTAGVVGDQGGIVGRLGKNLAALEFCANVARVAMPEVFGEIDFRTMIENLWRWAQSEGSGADPALEAVMHIRNLCAANATKFWPRGTHEPADGWWGFWNPPTPENINPHIYIRPEVLMAKLKLGNFDGSYELLADWTRKGYLVPDRSKHGKKQGRGIVAARKKIKCGNVELVVLELVPPAENAEILETYEALAKNMEASDE